MRVPIRRACAVICTRIQDHVPPVGDPHLQADLPVPVLGIMLALSCRG